MELNILIIGSSRTGKSTLSNALYHHHLVENNQTHILENEIKPSINKITKVEKKFNLKILSTSSFTNTTINKKNNLEKRKKKFDFIICIMDITNLNSWKFIKSFLTENNELDEEYFSMNKIIIVVSREDLLKELISISFNEIESLCEQLNIQFYLTNLINQSSKLNLVNKIINHISLNHFNLIDNLNINNNNNNINNNLQLNKILFDTLDTPFVASTEIN